MTGREAPQSTGSPVPGGLSPRLVVGVLIAALAVIFVLQNTHSAKVNLLLWKVEAPGWLWFASLFLAGLVVGSVFPWMRRRRRGG